MRALVIVALVVLVPASLVFAQETGRGAGGVQLTGARDAESLEQLIVDLYAASVRIVGLAAFLMLLYAGVRRLMGNVQESNRIIMDAIVGTVLLLSSVVILNSINPDTVVQEGRVLDPDRFDPPGERGLEQGTGGGGGSGFFIDPFAASVGTRRPAILPIIVQ